MSRKTNRLKSRFSAVSGVMALLLVSSTARSALGQAEQDSIGELRSRIASNIETIAEIGVSVTIERKAAVEEDVLQKWLGKGSSGTSSEKFAMRGDKRYIEKTHQAGPAPTRPEVDPNSSKAMQERAKRMQAEYDKIMGNFEKAADKTGLSAQDRINLGQKSGGTTSTAFDGNVNRSMNYSQGAGSILPGQEPATQRFQSLYFNTVALFIDDQSYGAEVKEVASAGLLPRTLALSEYTLSEESLRGIACYKLEGKTGVGSPIELKDVLWLAKDYNLMLIQRELIDLESNEVQYRGHCDDPKEVLPGIWLPKNCGFDEFAPSNAPDDVKGKPLLSTTLKVDEFITNVDESLFEIEFPPGTIVSDSVTGKTMGLGNKVLQYRMPSDPNDLDRVIRQAAARSRGATRLMIMLAVMGCGLIVGFLIYRQRK